MKGFTPRNYATAASVEFRKFTIKIKAAHKFTFNFQSIKKKQRYEISRILLDTSVDITPKAPTAKPARGKAALKADIMVEVNAKMSFFGKGLKKTISRKSKERLTRFKASVKKAVPDAEMSDLSDDTNSDISYPSAQNSANLRSHSRSPAPASRSSTENC